MVRLSGARIARENLTGWAYLAGGLQTRIRTSDFAAGLSLVNAIAIAATKLDHHPDLDLRSSHVDVRLSSRDAHGVLSPDLQLAWAISAIVAAAGLEQECASVSRLELALDTAAFGTVLPFWREVLATGQPNARKLDDELRDPFGALPLIWFQKSGHEEPRQRWHLDLWLDPTEVPSRIDAALAAGGTLVSDEHAPSFWVLADPEGNKVCLNTWQ